MMQKWEYCAVVGLIKGKRTPESYHPAIWYFTDQGFQAADLKGQEVTEIARTIAWLGDEGWEMVGCVDIAERYPAASFGNLGVDNSAALLFKRPKQ